MFISQNLNTSLGLYNSSPGTVVDIVYEKDSDPNEDLPKYVLVELDNYNGDKFEGKKIFPVEPKK